MLSQFSQPVIFAHRGASAYAPENTIAAFKLAVEQGADAIELDAKLSFDGQVVVIHDQTVDRTTTGSGRIKDMAYSELRYLDAGSHFDCAYVGESIPTLDEVFDNFGHQTFINVELTNYASPLDELPAKIAQIVKQRQINKSLLFSSFNPIPLIRIRRLLPDIPIALLALPGRNGAWARSWPGRLLKYQALHPEVNDVTPAMMEQAHKHGYRIHVYTVNQVDVLHRLKEMQVDGIFTDDPLLARQVLSPVSI